MITFVVAQDENGTIGKDGSLPWSLPADMKFFKEMTLTGDILMGRKTFESFPNGPLKDRENLVLTRQEDYEAEGAFIFNNKEEALEHASNNDKPLHVIGGAEIFRQFLDDVDIIYVTVVHEDFEGDTEMPEIDYSLFELVEEKEGHVDEKNKYPHTFYTYKRK